jgi:hypothetical protein
MLAFVPTAAANPAKPPRMRSSLRVPASLLVLVVSAAAGPIAAAGAEPNDGSKNMVQTSGKPSARVPAKVNADELVTLFPGTLGDWQQTELGKTPPRREPGPSPAPSVVGEYKSGEHTAAIKVFSGVLPPAVKPGKRQFSRTEHTSPQQTAVTVSLANGVQITASSRTADAAALEALLQAIDLTRAEALRPGR